MTCLVTRAVVFVLFARMLVPVVALMFPGAALAVKFFVFIARLMVLVVALAFQDAALAVIIFEFFACITVPGLALASPVLTPL